LEKLKIQDAQVRDLIEHRPRLLAVMMVKAYQIKSQMFLLL